MYFLLGLLFAANTSTWVVSDGEVEVDWSLGVMTARGDAAADLRMPGPTSSRPGANRRAVVSADDKLRSALNALAERSGETLSKAGIRVLMEHAETNRTEYQSNGGVVLWRSVQLARVKQEKNSSQSLIPLKVPSMPFRVAPSIQSIKRKVAPAYALYRRAPAPAHALVAKWDASTGLTLAIPDAGRIDTLAGAGIEIFIDKLEP